MSQFTICLEHVSVVTSEVENDGLVPSLLAKKPVLWSARLQTPRRRNRAVRDWG